MSKSSQIETMIAIISRLIELMEQENGFLATMQPQEIRALQEEKTRLAGAYERCMKSLKTNPGVLAAADPGIKAELRSATLRFQEALVENERALRAVKTVSERLLNVIVSSLAEKQSGPGYSAIGAFSKAGATGNGKAISLALNEQL